MGVKYVILGQKKLGFYVLGGGGFYLEKVSNIHAHYTEVSPWGGTRTVDVTVQFEEEKTSFGITAGGGLIYKLSQNLALFGESLIVNSFAEDSNTSFLPIRIGIILYL